MALQSSNDLRHDNALVWDPGPPVCRYLAAIHPMGKEPAGRHWWHTADLTSPVTQCNRRLHKEPAEGKPLLAPYLQPLAKWNACKEAVRIWRQEMTDHWSITARGFSYPLGVAHMDVSTRGMVSLYYMTLLKMHECWTTRKYALLTLSKCSTSVFCQDYISDPVRQKGKVVCLYAEETYIYTHRFTTIDTRLVSATGSARQTIHYYWIWVN